jgi:hypothetical protein
MSRAANPQRGEAHIVLDGQPFVIRPSFEALVLAEEELGSLFAMVERASDGALTISEMTGLIWHCLPVDTRPERGVVGSALLAMGLVEATKPVRVIFSQVLKGSA